MSVNRWRVEQLTEDTWGDKMFTPEWIVWPPSGDAKIFPTLPEAHTFAMQQSRTVEVELPVDLSSAPISGSWKDPTESWMGTTEIHGGQK